MAGVRRTVNAFLEFLPTVGLAMVVNLRRGYPDTVLAEKFLMHCWKPFSLHHLVVQLWYHQVIQERGLSAPYIQIQSTNWVEKLAPAEPLALEESLWRAAARSVTIICTIRKVQKMPPSAHVPTIGTGELARGGRCW